MGYLDLVDSFRYKEPLFRSKLDALAENDVQLKSDGWAQNTKTLFFQAAVPTGWTVDASHNNKALRVVSGTGTGSGGSTGLSSTISLAHTHTITTDDSHTHAFANHTHFLGGGTGGTSIGNPTAVFTGGGTFNRFLSTPGSGSTVSALRAVMSTPGAVTLGTEPNHDHGGVTDSQLSDVVLAYCDVLIGTKNAPSGTYTDLSSYWHTGDKIDFDPFDQYADNDAYNSGNLMPSGTVMIFGQQSAPTGWTKLATINDRMLRIVSASGGGTGGSQPLSSGISLAHTHTVTAIADHHHSVPAHSHSMSDTDSLTDKTGVAFAANQVQANGSGTLVQTADSGSTASRTIYQTLTTSSGNGNTSDAGGHTHTLPSALANIQFTYLDVIQCSKDSSGEPYSYTDMTSVFAWKKLVSKQRLNNLAKNDAYILYHTTPTTTKALFYMASAPTGWTKITSHDDKALRIVSGGTGGQGGGGSQVLSATITLGHLHNIVAGGGHSHTASHTHPLSTSTASLFPASSTVLEGRGGNRTVSSGHTGSNIQSSVTLSTTTLSNTQTPDSQADHDHDAATNSQLSDITLAYADVLYCQKD